MAIREHKEILGTQVEKQNLKSSILLSSLNRIEMWFGFLTDFRVPVGNKVSLWVWLPVQRIDSKKEARI